MKLKISKSSPPASYRMLAGCSCIFGDQQNWGAPEQWSNHLLVNWNLVFQITNPQQLEFFLENA